MNNETVWGFAKNFYDNDLTTENLKIRYMISSFTNGFPIQPNDTFRFDNATHFGSEQRDLLKEHLLDAKKKFDAQIDVTEKVGFKADFFTFIIVIDQILLILI